ncbi:hypothetical protein BDA96_01G082100 [Sorghum bicolor]|uniref:Uncharacterized protein n=2 Tax=Sorghum bicolor TaxID=4558 RepID=A0A921RXD4_SORBI|nr:hypothetical protein BDA96_01G082100 [Sorghum bicolor]KXG37488.1 hypothetical protein SORBI_3001G079000 [Sorghum bicolor]
MWANPEAIWATGTGAKATRHSAPIPSAISRQIFLSFFFPANMIHALTPSLGWLESRPIFSDGHRRDATRSRIPGSSTGTSLALLPLFLASLRGPGHRLSHDSHRLHSNRQQT